MEYSRCEPLLLFRYLALLDKELPIQIYYAID